MYIESCLLLASLVTSSPVVAALKCGHHEGTSCNPQVVFGIFAPQVIQVADLQQ